MDPFEKEAKSIPRAVTQRPKQETIQGWDFKCSQWYGSQTSVVSGNLTLKNLWEEAAEHAFGVDLEYGEERRLNDGQFGGIVGLQQLSQHIRDSRKEFFVLL